jgi:hypothetical protein
MEFNAVRISSISSIKSPVGSMLYSTSYVSFSQMFK